MIATNGASPLAQGRGLKRIVKSVVIEYPMSPLAQGRGLKRAYYGLPGIRKTWVEKTALKEKILALAESLLAEGQSSTASF